MKRYVLFVFLSLTLLLSACTKSEEEKIQVYLEEISFYDILIEFTDGELNIEVLMLDHADTWNSQGQLDVHVETKKILEAVKSYSELVKEVNLDFITRDLDKTVAEIKANHDTVMETNWEEVASLELPKIVDGYKFYGH